MHTQKFIKKRSTTYVLVQDLSENYTCLVPDEVQSLHWSQTQVTLFPVATFWKVINGNLLEITLFMYPMIRNMITRLLNW